MRLVSAEATTGLGGDGVAQAKNSVGSPVVAEPVLVWKPHGECQMNVNNVGSNSPVQKIVANPVQKQVPADAPKQLRASDRLELSGVSHLLNSLKSNDVRADKVAAVKVQIESGTYEDDKKLNVAVDKLLDDLMK